VNGPRFSNQQLLFGQSFKVLENVNLDKNNSSIMPEDESGDGNRSNIEFTMNKNEAVSRELDFNAGKDEERKSENCSNESQKHGSSYDSSDEYYGSEEGEEQGEDEREDEQQDIKE
jgi:hypothetical protein